MTQDRDMIDQERARQYAALYTYTTIDWWLGQSAERAALAEIRRIVEAAIRESDLSKLDLKRILELCGKEEER